MGHTRMKATLAAIVLVGVFFSKVQCDSNGTGDCNSVTTSTTSTGVTITSSNGYSISSITYANGTLASMKNLSSSSITNLQPFTKYILNITNGNETCSKIITTNPSMPEFLSLKNVQKNSISLEWTPPANMTGADFTYNITYSSSQGAWSVTNSTAYANLVSLVPGTNYTISVVTVAGGNYTSLPAIISSYTRPERIPLGNITVINNHSTSSLQISWNQPPGIVELYTIAIQGAVNQTKNSTTAQPVTFTSLLPGREYTVTITTASGPYNETSDPVTGVTYPSMPESLNLKKVQKNSISLEWTRPANMTGADLIYNITYTSSQGAWSVTNSTEYANLVSLIPGTKYTISVVTVAAGNYTSLPAVISSYTRPEQIPPGNITVINNHSTSSLQISWNQPPGIVELYTIAIQGAVNQTQNSTTVEPVTFKSLLPGREYTFTITTASGPYNETSDPVTGVTYPSMPEFLSLKNVQKNSISLEWRPPANMTGADFIYNITYTSSNGVWNVTNSTAYADLVSLVPGTNYTIRIVTVAAGNYTSLPAFISSYTRPERIPPGNITVIDSHSTSSLQISWNQPPGIVELYTIAIQGAVNQTQNSTTAQPVTFISLLPGREYTVTITTASGPYNETSGPVTGVTYPSMPEFLSLKNVQKNSISLEWTPAANMTGVDLIYNITYSSSQGVWNVTNSTAYANLVGLVPGTNYTIRIVTVAAANYTSLPAFISSFTRPERIPLGNITVINNHSTSALQVIWNQPPGIVELYTIAIQGAVNQTQNSTTAQPVTFTSLLPGREYTVTITTVSGPYNETSDPVTGVTSLATCAETPSRPDKTAPVSMDALTTKSAINISFAGPCPDSPAPPARPSPPASYGGGENREAKPS
ncbi:receptor-type tyrosine-protein phosphatase beta-like [Ambystoma mexicanum]|uniref:receptor-type tyrosine-protein phosphatase beta-like n=1 Tax=Ambystoma mexicanum TaxID=8296 RepID=UPI0037E89EB6